MSRTDATEAQIRPGEETLAEDPAATVDATLHFIGRIRTPWGPGNCPRNISSARESGEGARIELSGDFGPGLAGLRAGQAIVAMYWMDRARRDLIVQCPRHVEGARGTFALRSPHRPNPLALSVVTIRSVDVQRGVIEIDALDCFDGTPLVDLKPWLPSIDAPVS